MSGSKVDWALGPEALRAELLVALSGDAPGVRVLRDNPRRRILRLDRPGGALLIKHFRMASGRHTGRERLKELVGASPADRERRHLETLHERGARVPRPIAAARLGDGDRLLVLPFLDGRSWQELPRGRARREAARALGAAVRTLHDAGVFHGDLHLGNVLFTEEGAVVLDLQHARKLRGEADRLRDLGELDFALWPLASRADRLRVQLAGLDLPGVGADRAALRQIAVEARKRGVRHAASRTRRSLRPGRRFAALDLPAGRGLRLREVPEALVEEALAAHTEAFERGDPRVWKDEGRSRISAVHAGGRDVVVKETRAEGGARRVADLWRGSAARRAWRAGHGLIVRDIAAALPLAFVEGRTLGLPGRSWLVLERLPGPDALTQALQSPDASLDAMLDVLSRLHARGVDHGDLKATNLVADGHGGLALVDLEQVRFPDELAEERRIEGLAELNASLPDQVANAARRLRFDRYARRHPFDRGQEAALRAIIQRSRDRQHRWTGQGCEPEG